MATKKTEPMEILRGTTPSIVLVVKNNIDLSQASQVWMYIYQKKQLKVDKLIQDVTIDVVNKTITLRLEQEDTLNLKSGEAIFQVRLLTNDGNAYGTVGAEVEILEAYKDGVIS